MGVLHSRWSVRKLTSDCLAFGVVARARPTGMLTKPKLMDPFQIVRMGPLPVNSSEGPAPFASLRCFSCSAVGRRSSRGPGLSFVRGGNRTHDALRGDASRPEQTHGRTPLAGGGRARLAGPCVPRPGGSAVARGL